MNNSGNSDGTKHKKINYVFCNALKDLRRKADLKQIKLAEAAGVTEIAVSSWERGQYAPNEDNLKKLIAVFLKRSAFTVGNEKQEATTFWQQSGRPEAFDTSWFDTLLHSSIATPEIIADKPERLEDIPVEPAPENDATLIESDIEPAILRVAQATPVLPIGKTKIQRAKRLSPIFVVVGLLIIILAGAGLFFLTNGGGSKQANPIFIKLPGSSQPQQIVSLGLNLNGQYLAVASVQPSLQIWKLDKDFSQSRLIKELKGASKYYFGVRNNFGFKMLAAASKDNTVKIWTIEADGLPSDTPALSITTTANPIRSVSLSRDSTMLASSGKDNSIDLWDAKSGQLFKSLPHQNNIVWRILFSPTDVNLLATAGSDQIVKLWDIQTGTFRQLLGHKAEIHALVFSGDGQLLATGSDDGAIIVWSVTTGQKLHEFIAHSKEVNTLDFSSDRQFLASGGADDLIKIWSIPNYTVVATANTQSEVTTLQFCYEDQALVFGTDLPEGAVKLWHWVN